MCVRVKVCVDVCVSSEGRGEDEIQMQEAYSLANCRVPKRDEIVELWGKWTWVFGKVRKRVGDAT